MKCKNSKCENEANPTMGTGKFCSRSCSNSRIRTEEIKRKISRGVKKTAVIRPPLKDDVRDKWISAIKKCWEDKYQSKSFDELGMGHKRRRVIEEQGGKCADCGLSEWKSIPINLEMDHKDGDGTNNNRNNLWALCPNCHSTTETWRGRNKNRGMKLGGSLGYKKVTDAELIEAIKTTPTIRQALLSVGLAAKGGNYDRVKELKSVHKL